MALNGNRILYSSRTGRQCTCASFRRAFLIPTSTPSWSRRRTNHHFIIVSASKKLSSSRTGKLDSKSRGSSISTKVDEKEKKELERTAEIDGSGATEATGAVDDGFVMPELPGDKPDFWEGPQWDLLGFIVQYLWAFGIAFALMACGIAVATYNEGATDFKETPAYKESLQSQELLEEPDASNSDVFESNPTDQAPSLE